MIRIKVIIPVKLTGAKSRLASILHPEERTELTLSMFTDVMKTVQRSPSITGTFVVSPDNSVIDAVKGQVDTILEGSVEGIDAAIRKAVKCCADFQDEAVLILPVDIPLITLEDVEKIASSSIYERAVVVAPSKDGGGTNGLLLKPAGIIPTRYGKNSFNLHVEESLKIGIVPKVYRSPTIELDIDTPRDLAEFVALKRETTTHRYVVKRGIDRRLMELAIPLQIGDSTR